jgi:PEP-CTERM motif-containing protein
VTDLVERLLGASGANGTSPNVLYFAAGINEEVNGLFGSIAVVPEPSTLWLAAFGGLVLVVVAKRRGSGQRKKS